MAEIPQWLAKFGISKPGGSWEAHIARKSAGGVDFPAPVGTPILAPAGGGRLTFHMLTDGSSIARVTRPDGTCTEFLHHSNRYGVARDVAGDEEIALSDGREGAWGAGGSSGPHIHVHDKRTTNAKSRVYPYSTVTGGGGGGGGTTPKPNQEDEPMIVKYLNQSDGLRNWIVWDNVTKQYDQIVGQPEAVQPTANLWAGVSIQGNIANEGTVSLFQWIVKTYTKGTFPFAPSSTSAPLPADVARKSDVEAIPAAVILEMKKPGN